jgi:hypothetical protein
MAAAKDLDFMPKPGAITAAAVTLAPLASVGEFVCFAIPIAISSKHLSLAQLLCGGSSVQSSYRRDRKSASEKCVDTNVWNGALSMLQFCTTLGSKGRR